MWIATFGADQQLLLRTSTDAGRHFSAPRVLPTAGEAVAADGENRPKIAFGPGGVVVVSYTQPRPKPFTGFVRLLRSDDGGRSFAPPITVHHDRSEITHRFENIAFDARGRLHAVWIDKRDLEQAPKGRYRGAAIYWAVSGDGGRSFAPETKLADHSCECCRIALAPTADGGIAALWRHVFEPNQRDHALARLVPGAPLQRATHDGWAIDACPHHGPGLAAAADGGFHAVWFGERQGVPGVRYGRLDAHGAPEGEARLLPDEGAEHADVAAAGERVAVVWRSFAAGATRLRAWCSTDGGRRFTLRELASSIEENDQPRLLRHGDRLIALWRDAQEVHVETLFD
ncbi:MAG: sialidase family protein [Pseudomonadota bacterium]